MITKFINYLTKIKGYSPNTARAYESDIRTFARWANANLQNARWSTLTREDIDNYIQHQTDEGQKPATTNRQLSSISSLYKYLQREGLLKDNPTKYESRRKMAETIPNTIPYNEIRMAYSNAQGATRTMIGILATTGIRIQEMLDMQWADINLKEGTIKVMGKGSKERIVKTQPEILSDLVRLNETISPSGKLFYLDQRTARFMIWKALQPYSQARQLSPHAIRHSMATEMAKNGANATTIASILGHSSISTTQRYIDMSKASCTYSGINLINQ